MVLSALFTSLKLFAIARAGLIPPTSYDDQLKVDNKAFSLGTNTGYLDTAGHGAQVNFPGMNQQTIESLYVAPPGHSIQEEKQMEEIDNQRPELTTVTVPPAAEVLSNTRTAVKDEYEDLSYEEGSYGHHNTQVGGCAKDEDLSYEEGSYGYPQKLNANDGSPKTMESDFSSEPETHESDESDFSSESESDETGESEIPGVPRKILSQTDVYVPYTSEEEEETAKKTAGIAPESTYTGL